MYYFGRRGHHIDAVAPPTINPQNLEQPGHIKACYHPFALIICWWLALPYSPLTSALPTRVILARRRADRGCQLADNVGSSWMSNNASPAATTHQMSVWLPAGYNVLLLKWG